MDLHRHEALRVNEGDILVGRHLGSVMDWTRCGTTCDPDIQCQALTAKSMVTDQCPKQASIQLLLEREARSLTTDGLVRLCGGHFTVHRSGKDLIVVAR